MSDEPDFGYEGFWIDLVAKRDAEIKKLRAVNEKIGFWLSAALEDSQVCEEMKRDIRDWFAAHN